MREQEKVRAGEQERQQAAAPAAIRKLAQVQVAAEEGSSGYRRGLVLPTGISTYPGQLVSCSVQTASTLAARMA